MLAPRPRDDRRAPAAQPGTVENVVVDNGRHVDKLDRRGTPDRCVPGAGSSRKQDQKGPQPLAAGSQHRTSLRGEHRPMAGGDLDESSLHGRHASR